MKNAQRLRLLAVVVLSALAGAGCGAGTGGQAILVDIAVQGSGQRSFTTSSGWQVTLDEAAVALGPVYFAENPPPRAATWTEPTTWWAALGGAASSMLLPTAHAHAGDNQFNGGQVFAELAEFVVVDAIADASASFPATSAVAGRVRSWELALSAAAVSAGPPLDGHQAFARGTATRDGVVVRFAGGTTPESDARRRVQGLPIDEELVDGAALVIVARPEAWLDAVDFSAAGTVDVDGVTRIEEGSAAAAYWSAALRGVDAWAVRVE